MARIRTIKPEFPQSETIGTLSRDARLLFIQLWTIADDHGRAKAAPRLLASLLYPYDEDAADLMPTWLCELEQKGCIRLYQVDGNRYLDIPSWSKHQRVDNAGKSQIPAFRDDSHDQPERVGSSPQTAANIGEPRLDLGPRTKEEDLGPRTETRAVADATRPPVPDRFDEFWREYPRRDGSNPKEPARKLFTVACKTGEPPDRIIEGAKGYRRECERLKIAGTDKVAQAQTWLRQLRWGDYVQAAGGEGAPSAEKAEYLRSRGWVWSEAEGKLVQIQKPPDVPRETPEHERA